MSLETALHIVRSHPLDTPALEQLARIARDEGEEEKALPLLRQAVEKSPSARLWQWKALLERSIDELDEALKSFAEAARLDPGDVGIAHGQARVAMEAGIDAEPLYLRALTLAPRSGPILIGLAAARAAIGRGEQGADELAATLDQWPMWLRGHEQLAQLVATLGRPDQATTSLEKALDRFPAAVPLWETLLHVQLRRGDHGSLLPIVERAEAAGVGSPEFAIYRGIHAAEFDEETYPAALFDQAPPHAAAALGRSRIRHLLRVGAVEAALPLIDREIEGEPNAESWAYASTAWRLAGDSRSDWLEGDERLVTIIDLSNTLPPIDGLASTLRSLHVAKGEYLDQSVRGGTQTDGPLLSRVDPVIRHLRKAIVEAVRQYLSQMPAPDSRHPVLRHRRDRRVRFAGSWSVRLGSGGRHSNHVHPLGWLSSALYISLPSLTAGEPEDAGWFTLGQPDGKLEIALPPSRTIEPKVGQLILFPSTMWHGTLPFEQGERLTVAFDVAPPV